MTGPTVAMQVGVHEAKTQLSKLLRLVDEGQEIEIQRHGETVARLVPAERRPVPQFDTDAGLFEVPEDFDEPMPDEFLQHFR